MRGEGLHDVEDAGRLALVAGERGALGERVGDDDEPLRRERLQVDRAARRNLVLLVGGDLDDRALLLVARELADDPLPKRADDVVLLERRKPDRARRRHSGRGRRSRPARPGRRAARSTGRSSRSRPEMSSRSPSRSARAVLRRPATGGSVRGGGLVHGRRDEADEPSGAARVRREKRDAPLTEAGPSSSVRATSN